MSWPENSEIAAELRASAPVAPPELRDRVRGIASREHVAAPPRRARRLGWAFAPAVAAAMAGAIVVAVGSLDGSGTPAPTVAAELGRAEKSADALQAAGSTATSPIQPGDRAQLYLAQLTLRVDDLSGSTQRALRTTRALGGYIRTVDYGSGPKSGTADLVVRVPIDRVQQAIVRFSGLGTILDQQVSVRDVQPTLNRRSVRIAELRRTIPTLSGDERLQAEAELQRLQLAQARDRQRTSFATVALHLQTKEAAIVVPTTPSRIERAFERAADVVTAEVAGVVYALVVAAPFILLGAALAVGTRLVRRRSDARLLA
jgi:hypothetical protein